ncbi:polysaccharide biosynthesis tyrosine autokinase [Burkholderia pseudomultivorans]|uniref:Putative tyrosine-protein kinase EpsB n=1 Tax=Burkholderia pseudomultivorans TaxID=1207504 RepID=A0A6P2KEY6_9BURK|nr:polysaccharide biosynthesis tyrosine autokinase [Burkholderia pseudomultivorans]MDR8726497.1 Tyrosine-protein kinase wzc [Burkholderia pseudomultivorans]MDR8736330.1 Tyrosine-protein kinase wzc [Burkholderia pseudomultivorans]MDR8742144.1 Tyrosine-protein kinase wzc [Burkholderia pseudomultivorans]MDR8753928.1 Tyrosine-protein kinase wzc [Burkholderia pseudomultivorans]MDR8778962.1 Tyrosine-protein kinase wzc [Burkholderia pseudomultivorans]
MSSTHQPVNDPNNESDTIDLTGVLDLLVENRLLITIVAALFVLIGGLYAFLATPIYESNIVTQIEDSPDSSAKSLLGNLSSIFDVKSSADTETQILGSRLVVSGAVDTLKLYITAEPKRFPLIGGWISRHSKSLSRPGFLGMGGYTWGRESIDVDTFDVPSDLYEHKYTLTYLGNDEYSLAGDGLDQPVRGKVGKLETIRFGGGALQINVRSISAESGAVFLLKRYSRQQTIDELQKNLKVQSLGKDSDVISASLQSDDPELLAKTLNELGHQYVKQNAERKAAQADQSLQFLMIQEPQRRHELDTSEELLNDYRHKHATLQLDAEGKIILQQSADAQTKLLELRQKRQELMTRFGDSHPAVVAINDQINAVQANFDQITDRIKSMPLEEQGQLRLERDVRVNTDLYLALRNNIEQLRLLKAGKIGNVRLVDTAYQPERPVKPKKLLVVAASGILGLLVGIGLAALRETLFRGVTDPHALEVHSGLNVITTVPHSRAQIELAGQLDNSAGRSLLLVNAHADDPAIESLRSLRTSLQFSLLDARNNVVMVTGPAPGVGKSFVSANLAGLFAMSDKRVLLIDGDMRRGQINKYLAVTRERGLAELLGGAIDVTGATRREILPNLDFIPTGTLPANPAELLMNGRLKDIIAAASRQYDLVVVDAPPVLAVSDAEIIAPLAGTVYLIAMFGKTRTGEISESAKRLRQAGSVVTGLLFNGMKARGGKYSYGGKYATYRYISYKYDTRDE